MTPSQLITSTVANIETADCEIRSKPPEAWKPWNLWRMPAKLSFTINLNKEGQVCNIGDPIAATCSFEITLIGSK